MKRGQLNQALIVMIAALLLVSVFSLGFWGMQQLNEAQCQAELIKFRQDFESVSSKISANTGKTTQETFLIPCDYDRLYFADFSKDVTFNALNKIPMIVDSLRSGQERNLFFIKNGRVEDSVYIENLDLQLPYYLCVSVKNNKIQLIFENNMGKTMVRQPQTKADCSFEEPNPVELSVGDMSKILLEIYKKNDTILKSKVVDPIATDIKREVIYREDLTLFNITKMNGSFDYYVIFPSCMIRSLNESEHNNWTDMNSWSTHTNISDSPAIVKFSFTSAGEESIHYSVNDSIEPGCIRSGLIGIGMGSDTYPSVADVNAVIDHRKQTNSPTMNLALSKAAVSMEDKAEDQIDDLSERLSEMSTTVRFSSLITTKKVNLMGSIDKLKHSLREEPNDVPARYENLRMLANKTGYGEANVLGINNTLLELGQATHFARHLVARSYYKDLEGFEFDAANDPRYPDICYDGSISRDVCVNITHIREVEAVDGLCKHDTAQPCPAGTLCVFDMCAERDGLCGDNDNSSDEEFKVRAVGERNITEYSSDADIRNGAWNNLFDCDDSGTVRDFPWYNAGDSIEFRINVNTGQTFYSDNASNPNNERRAVFEDLGSNLWMVGFEDGNDTSYDDCVFMVRGATNTSTGLAVADPADKQYFKKGECYHWNKSFPDFCRGEDLVERNCRFPQEPNETVKECEDYGLECRGGACRMPLPECKIEIIDGVRTCLEDGEIMKTQTCMERDNEVIVQEVYCEEKRCRRTPPRFVGYSVRCSCKTSINNTGGYVC